ncbi:MAG: UPF0147 family protein [Nitrososphaeria archaeon]|jgi:uncharacterized protein (UPF0147 family)
MPDDNAENIRQAVAILQSLANDTVIPRNVRRSIKDVIDTLNDSSLSQAVRAANAVTALEEIAQDPNMPSYARVTLWNAFSYLERIREA